jgi:PiT family inorganic phosphate transporter
VRCLRIKSSILLVDSRAANEALEKYISPAVTSSVTTENARERVASYLQTRRVDDTTLPALQLLGQDIAQEVARYGSYALVPDENKGNVRNDMYLVSETLNTLTKAGRCQLRLAIKQ